MRSGTDAARLQCTLEEAELFYVPETYRMYIGDGFTPGGIMLVPEIEKVCPYTPVPYKVERPYREHPQPDFHFYIVLILFIIWEILRYYHIILP